MQVFDAIEMFDDGAGGGVARLTQYGHGHSSQPLAGFWTVDDVDAYEDAARLA